MRESSVADRVVSLSLAESGVPRRFPLYDSAVCAALMIDLALAGRLSNEADSLFLTEGVGRPSAEALFDEMMRDPGRDLAWWLVRASTGLTEVLQDAEQDGHLRRRPRTLRHPLKYRYEATDAAAVELDVQRINEPNDRSLPWDPPSAAVAALGIASGLQGAPRTPPSELIKRTEHIAWLVSSLTATLIEIDQRNRATAFAVR
jgi:hypothetical protein